MPRGPRRALYGELAASDRHVLVAEGTRVHVLDPATLEDIRVLDVPGSAVAVAGDLAAIGGPDGITLVDLRDGTRELLPSLESTTSRSPRREAPGVRHRNLDVGRAGRRSL